MRVLAMEGVESRSEQRGCISCGCSSHFHVLEKADPASREPLVLEQCARCGIVYLRGYDSTFQAELYDYYADSMDKPASLLFRELNRRRYRELLDVFGTKLASARRRLLDVGCGYGAFVAEARGRGWDATGIDLSEAAVALAERHGVPVTKTDFFKLDCLPGSLDIITMFELLEHVPHPARYIARAAELLRTGGLLYLTTPNFASLDRRLAGTDWRPIHREHLAYYTPTTLRALLAAEHRLSVASIRSRNVSIAIAKQKILRCFGRPPAGNAGSSSARKSDQSAREAIDSSRFLRLAKSGANALLDSMGLGNTIVALCGRV
ncbi:MAG: class I SAM-dependent methyltransferase [Polyangiaceae bacterium]|nr:class I SAM-dependent methyltransferase [Polyangiaceae bacterium]